MGAKKPPKQELKILDVVVSCGGASRGLPRVEDLDVVVSCGRGIPRVLDLDVMISCGGRFKAFPELKILM